jgi:hypothetical protein
MSVTVQTVINNARTLLQDTDTGGIRWTDPELIAWLNEATAEVVRIHPEANSKNIDHNLVAGTKQRIPTDGVQLINVIRNVGVGGAPGRVIRLIDHNIMNNERPDWHMETPTAVATRFTFDHKDPFNFYVYPPNSGTGRVTLVYSGAPTVVTAIGNDFPITAIYAAPVVNYICFRAWMKQVGDAASEQRAASYLALFNNAMGVKKTAEVETDPNARGMNGRL